MAEATEPTGSEALAILERLQAEGHVSKALVQEQLATVRRGIHSDTHTRVKGAYQVQEKRELEPEQIEEFIRTLKANFTSNGEEFPQLHPNVKWAEVEASLRRQPKVMWSLSKMEETGGKVDVTEENYGSFLFEDTSRESPTGRRNLVYDEAEIMAKRWGVDLEDEAQYRVLQNKVPLDRFTWSLLKKPTNVREDDRPIIGGCHQNGIEIIRINTNHHRGDFGFRCAVSVEKMA